MRTECIDALGMASISIFQLRRPEKRIGLLVADTLRDAKNKAVHPAAQRNQQRIGLTPLADQLIGQARIGGKDETVRVRITVRIAVSRAGQTCIKYPIGETIMDLLALCLLLARFMQGLP